MASNPGLVQDLLHLQLGRYEYEYENREHDVMGMLGACVRCRHVSQIGIDTYNLSKVFVMCTHFISKGVGYGSYVGYPTKWYLSTYIYIIIWYDAACQGYGIEVEGR